MLAGTVIEDAYRKIGVVAEDEPMRPDQATSGLRALNRFMRSVQNHMPDLWLVASEDVVLSTATAAYENLTCVREMTSARLVRSGVETPMTRITRQEYDDLPIKTTTGLPSMWYFDRQRCGGTLYVWPVLAAAAGEIVRVTYERTVRDAANVGATVDAPAEWEEAIIYGLADRLADDNAKMLPKVTARAASELALVLARDREGSVYFHDEDR
jgi:hypothetical protein